MSRWWRQVLVLALAVVLAATFMQLAAPQDQGGVRHPFRIGEAKEYAPGLTITFQPVVIGSAIAQQSGQDRVRGVFVAVPYTAERVVGPGSSPRADLVTRDGVRYGSFRQVLSVPKAHSRCEGRIYFRVPLEDLAGARLELTDDTMVRYFTNGALLDLEIDEAKLAADHSGQLKDIDCYDTAEPR